MTWILIDGLDRSGKSSLTESYKKQGYTVVHMEAPSKKYYADNYSGESYFEELVRMYTKYDGQNVVFDRTPYGELIWPNIYGRKALLEAEDLDYLGELERNNNAERFLMYDKNTEAHWQRCVDNNEPLTRQQFGRASIFYDRLAHDYKFKKKQLTDFDEFSGITNPRITESVLVPASGNPDKVEPVDNKRSTSRDTHVPAETLEDKLELANAIKDVLQGKILKKKGGNYDKLEEQIKVFLQDKLEEIFVGKADKTFSEDEIMILKSMTKRIREKM